MDNNDWLLGQHAGEVIRQRVSDAERRRQIPGDLPPARPRRHRLASTLRRIADTIDT